MVKDCHPVGDCPLCRIRKIVIPSATARYAEFAKLSSRIAIASHPELVSGSRLEWMLCEAAVGTKFSMTNCTKPCGEKNIFL